jgi:hypothetical protein
MGDLAVKLDHESVNRDVEQELEMQEHSIISTSLELTVLSAR